MKFNYFTTEYAIITLQKIIQITGCLPGLKEIGNVDNVLEHI